MGQDAVNEIGKSFGSILPWGEYELHILIQRRNWEMDSARIFRPQNGACFFINSRFEHRGHEFGREVAEACSTPAWVPALAFFPLGTLDQIEVCWFLAHAYVVPL